MPKKKLIIFGIAILIVLGGSLYFFHQKKAHTPGMAPVVSSKISSSGSLAERANEEWGSRIDEVGATQAYEEFKTANRKESFQNQHLMAHVFGNLIYEKKGVDGIQICDSEFAFGCYHSFMTRAIAEQGEEVISYLDKKCIEKYGVLGTGCQHGIGHGIMEYTGPTKLEQAMTLCGKTTQLNPLFGCTSGVFMEYNIPLVLGDNTAGTRPRQFDAGKPYAPCPSLSQAKYRWSCYYELSQWWSLGNTPEHMGQLCHGLSDGAEREACLEGLGQTVTENNQYNSPATIAACKTMGNTSEVSLCLAGAAWSFYANPSFRSQDATLCDALSGVEKSTCRQKANLICNYISDTAAQAECAKGNTVF